MSLSLVAQSILLGLNYTWNEGQRTPILVTYSFANTADGYAGYPFYGSVEGFNQQQQNAARMALDAWSAISGLKFMEVPDIPAGNGIDIRFGMANLPTDIAGYGGYPELGDILLASNHYRHDSFAPGNYSYFVLLHEIGHALGLKHPFDGYPRLPDSLDNHDYTVMAYARQGYGIPYSLRAADVEAIQYLYGTQWDEEHFHIQWSWDDALGGIRHQGNDSDQTFRGTTTRDIILAGGGNDYLDGGAGNDLLAAGPGTNTAIGGAGRDTLETWLFRTEVQLTNLFNTPETQFSASYSGRLTGYGENTTFRGIETIAFGDGSLVFDDTSAVAQVTRLYQAALGRLPDAPGREAWTTALQNGASLSALADGFLSSDEFQSRFGQLDNIGFVVRSYELALRRGADPDGLSYWNNQLANGMSRAEMLMKFSESNENRGHTSQLVRNGLWDADEHAMQATRLYLAVLDRMPDAAGGHYWTDMLDGGVHLTKVANGFAESQEFALRFGAAADGDFINQVYSNVLDRPADGTGFDYWTGRLASGASRGELVAGFSESHEFILRHASILDNGITFA